MKIVIRKKKANHIINTYKFAQPSNINSDVNAPEKIVLNFNKRAEFRGKFHTYDNVMLENIRLLAKLLENGEKVLNFEIPEIKSYRNDGIELRNWIMSLTPEDRKRLKINKSTLWYRQKRIKEGKNIKIYNKVMLKYG